MLTTLKHFKFKHHHFKRYTRFSKPTRVNARAGNYDRDSTATHYPGSCSRRYRVHIPPSYREGKPLPLVMILHGCYQDHLDIQAISDFDTVADRENFITVYPFVTQYTDMRASNCWSWWRKRHTTAGSGEVEDLWQIVEQVSAEFSVNPKRIHIAGLSSGAGMAVAALTVHGRRFASGAAVAGVAYGELPHAVVPSLLSNKRRYRSCEDTVASMRKARGTDNKLPPLCIVHSHNDTTVHIEAAHNLRDAWLAYQHPQQFIHNRCAESHVHGAVQWTRTHYGRPLRPALVETLFLHGPGHGWCGGAPGRFSFPQGPTISNTIWHFMKSHRLT